MVYGIVSFSLPIGVFAMSKTVANDIASHADGTFVIVIAGRLNHRKLPLEALELISFLQGRLRKAVVVDVFGDGDQGYVGLLVKRANELNLSVNFYGSVPSSVVNTALKKCDLVINASLLMEAAPTTGLDVASHDKPYLYLTESGHGYTQKFNRRWSLLAPGFGIDSAELIVAAIFRDEGNLSCEITLSRKELINSLFGMLIRFRRAKISSKDTSCIKGKKKRVAFNEFTALLVGYITNLFCLECQH